MERQRQYYISASGFLIRKVPYIDMYITDTGYIFLVLAFDFDKKCFRKPHLHMRTTSIYTKRAY